MSVDENVRQQFIEDLSKVYKCEPNAYACAVAAYNDHKSYPTACSLAFGLSWRTHKDYLERVAKYWKENDDGAAITVEWMISFVEYYTTDVEKYPEDA